MDKKKKIIIIASCIVAVIVIGLVVFFLTKDNKKNDDTPKPTPAVAKESFTISFDTDGGEKLEDLKVEKGKEFTLPTPTKKGYTFDGWYLDDKKVDNSYTFTKDVTLVAKWTEETKTLKVVFDSNGGSKVKDMTFTCVDGAATLKNLPTPTKDNYDFRAWEDKHGTPILNGASITCDGDLKLFAAWDDIKPETKPEPEKPKEKKWTCPDGYTLKNTNKCESIKNPEYYCEEGKESNGNGDKVCYKWRSAPTATTCKNGGTYIEREHADNLCGYEEITRLTGNVPGCQQENGTMYSNHCYKRVELATESILNHTCPGTSAYRTSAQLGNTANSGCYDLSQRTYGCKTVGEGYSYNYSTGKCVKTIDAELK